MYNVLILGGTQFVGKNLAIYLIRKGYNVDILTRGKLPLDYEGINRHHICDRKNIEQLHNLLDHLSYDVIFDISAYDEDAIRSVDFLIKKETLKKYVFCSTGSVYADSKNTLYEDSTRALHPIWGSYGLNKMRAEDYLFLMRDKYNAPITIFRPTYIYGQWNNFYREGYLFDRIKNFDEIPIPIENSNRKQFIHIDDLVKTFESCIENRISDGNAYNLSFERRYTWGEVLAIVENIVDSTSKRIDIDFRKFNIEPRTFFPYSEVDMKFDTHKLEKDNLHVPRIDLEEGMKLAYRWYSLYRPELSDPFMTAIDRVLELER